VIRTPEDVAGSCNISKKDAARLYRFLFKELNPSVPKVDPESIIGKITSRLLLNGETERLAKAVLRQATSMRLTGGRGPAGMAAACIYISNQITGDRRTQSMIAEEAQVTEVTVRNRYKELVKLLEIEIQL
jgi:transcription initiation factor TFIIB